MNTTSGQRGTNTRRTKKDSVDKIRLWTLQPFYVWDRLCQEKTLWVDPNHEWFDRELLPAYDWMRQQMAKRLPNYEGHYPWWAYDYKIDLRTWRYVVLPPNERYVRLELIVPADQVLFGVETSWIRLLVPGGQYVPCGADWEVIEADLDAWEDELRRHDVMGAYVRGELPEPWHSKMVASWDRVFDVEEMRATNTIHATFERLELSTVAGVTEFITCARKER